MSGDLGRMGSIGGLPLKPLQVAIVKSPLSLIRGLLAVTAATAVVSTPAASAQTVAADEPQTVPAGTTSQVVLADSNILAVCTPPAFFHPNPTEWTVNPPTVTLGGTFGQQPTAASTLAVTVPADHPPQQTITISWTGNSSCVSYNGWITLRVGIAPDGKAGRALTKTVELAGDFRRDHRRLRRARHKKPNKKLKKAVKEIVRDGRKAKKLKKDYKKLALPKQGDVLVPCPVKRARRAERGCTDEVVEKAQDLWGFLKSLQELADYPKYQRKKADQYYKTPDGRQELDLRAAQNFGRGKTYGELNADQKQIIASQAQVSDGAIKRALRDAQNAGKAGSQLAF